MALHQYLQPRNGLPGPNSSLSSIIPSQAIAKVNQKVMDTTQSRTRKHGPYQQYTAKEQAAIGKYMYACNHSAYTAACIFSFKLAVHLNESTARFMSKFMLKAVAKSWGTEDDGEVAVLPKKCGRPLLLGQDLDTMVQVYLRKVRRVEELCRPELLWQLHVAWCCRAIDPDQ